MIRVGAGNDGPSVFDVGEVQDHAAQESEHQRPGSKYDPCDLPSIEIPGIGLGNCN